MPTKFFNTKRTSILCTNDDIRVSSIVRVRKMNGETVTLKVTEISDDIKNGQAGFDAHIATFAKLKSGKWGWKISHKSAHWAYTTQVFELVRF